MKKREKTNKLEGMLRAFERRNLAGKNGVFNVGCHPAVVPLFWVGLGTCREWGGCREGFPLFSNIIIYL